MSYALRPTTGSRETEVKQFVRLFAPVVLVIAAVAIFVGISLTRSDMANLEGSQQVLLERADEIAAPSLLLPAQQIRGMAREPAVMQALGLAPDEARSALQAQLAALLYRNERYDQARWLSKEGHELVRVRQGDEVPVAVPRDELADHSDRDWFKSIVSQTPGEMHVSALDLAREGDVPVVPVKPVIRLGVRLPEEGGRDSGVLVVNLRAGNLLERLRSIKHQATGESMLLLNPRGYWLLTPERKDAFGFALGAPGDSFAKRQPAEWARISAQPAGQMLAASGLWTWRTIDPAAVLGGRATAAEAWKLVAHVPAATITAMAWNRWWPLLTIAATALAVLGFGIRQYRKLWQIREAGEAERALLAAKEQTERRLQLATEGADVGVWYWDIATDKLDFSERCKVHLAVPLNEEPTFDKFFAAVHPEDREPTKQRITEATEKRQEYYAEYRIVNPDGSIRWIAAPGRVYTKPDGSPEGMSGLTIDITKLKETEASLRELTANLEKRVGERTMALADSQRRFQLLAENASDVVLETDRAGIIRWASPTARTQLGQDSGKVIDMPLKNLVHPEDWEAFDMLEQQAAKGSATNAEIRLKIDNDGYQWFLLSVRPLLADNGAISGNVASLRDIQKEVQSRETLKAERWRLKATLNSLIDPHVLMQAVRGEDGHVADFVYADANAAACQWLGIDRDHLLGRSLLELFPAIETTGLMKIYRETAETGRPASIDDFPFPMGETTRWLDIRAVRVDSRINFVWRDATDRHNAAEKIAASEERYRLLAQNSSDVVVRLDEDDKIAWVSPSLTPALGWNVKDWLGRKYSEFIPDADGLALFEADKKLLAEGKTTTQRLQILAKDGNSHWAEIHGAPYHGADGKIAGSTASLRIIDAEVQAEQEKLHQQEIIANERKHLADVIEGSDTGTWEWHVQTGALILNEVWAKLIGYRLEELLPTNIGTWEKFTHPEDLERAKAMLDRCFRREIEVYEVETRMRHRNGEWVWILTRGRIVEWTDDGKPRRMLGIHRDITAGVKLRQELERQATTDALTGLCNRREFEVSAHRELARTHRTHATVSLLMMDIDKFKGINDEHGHDAGDEVLKTIARACAPHLREVDVLARLGGEEFGVLLPDTGLDGARNVAERLREALGGEAVALGGAKSIRFTVSIGVAEHDGLSEQLPVWVKRADEALYRAKHSGRNCVCTS